jgi:hypothetical protein
MSVPGYKVGSVAICSLITRIATSLKLLEGATFEYIEHHREFYDLYTFGQGHLLKKVNDVFYAKYGEAAIRLPNPELALYHVQNYHVELQAEPVNERAPRRVRSERVTGNREPVWRGAETAREEPAHASFNEWDVPHHHSLNSWVYPPQSQPHQPFCGYYPPYNTPGTSEPGPSQPPRYSYDPFGTTDEEEEPHHDSEPRRHSDATGFIFTQQHYDEQITFQHNTTATLNRHDQRWNDQLQWNQNTTQTLGTIQENQEEAASMLHGLVDLLNIHYPPPPPQG